MERLADEGLSLTDKNLNDCMGVAIANYILTT
jgi:hypothetical protein